MAQDDMTGKEQSQSHIQYNDFYEPIGVYDKRGEKVSGHYKLLEKLEEVLHSHQESNKDFNLKSVDGINSAVAFWVVKQKQLENLFKLTENHPPQFRRKAQRVATLIEVRWLQIEKIIDDLEELKRKIKTKDQSSLKKRERFLPAAGKVGAAALAAVTFGLLGNANVENPNPPPPPGIDQLKTTSGQVIDIGNEEPIIAGFDLGLTAAIHNIQTQLAAEGAAINDFVNFNIDQVRTYLQTTFGPDSNEEAIKLLLGDKYEMITHRRAKEVSTANNNSPEIQQAVDPFAELGIPNGVTPVVFEVHDGINIRLGPSTTAAIVPPEQFSSRDFIAFKDPNGPIDWWKAVALVSLTPNQGSYSKLDPPVYITAAVSGATAIFGEFNPQREIVNGVTNNDNSTIVLVSTSKNGVESNTSNSNAGSGNTDVNNSNNSNGGVEVANNSALTSALTLSSELLPISKGSWELQLQNTNFVSTREGLSQVLDQAIATVENTHIANPYDYSNSPSYLMEINKQLRLVNAFNSIWNSSDHRGDSPKFPLSRGNNETLVGTKFNFDDDVGLVFNWETAFSSGVVTVDGQEYFGARILVAGEQFLKVWNLSETGDEWLKIMRNGSFLGTTSSLEAFFTETQGNNFARDQSFNMEQLKDILRNLPIGTEVLFAVPVTKPDTPAYQQDNNVGRRFADAVRRMINGIYNRAQIPPPETEPKLAVKLADNQRFAIIHIVLPEGTIN